MVFLGQGYYNEPYYQDPDPGLAEAEEPGNSDMFDDEAVRPLLLAFAQLIKCEPELQQFDSKKLDSINLFFPSVYAAAGEKK